MIRLSTVLWLVLVGCIGFVMFEVKYEVMALEDTLAKTNKAILADRNAIHVLNAEWSYLSQPSRLEELSRRFLDLQPLNTAQIGSIEAIPMRSPPAPAVAAAPAAETALPSRPAPAQPRRQAAPPVRATRLANAQPRSEQ